MSRRANPVAIGAFVLVALVIAIGTLVAIGSGDLLEERQTYVLYFPGAVSGLTVGAPVEFRGVRVGAVSSIQAVYDTQDEGIDIRVPVRIAIDADAIVGGSEATAGGAEAMQVLIQRGLRAQLDPRSIATGQLGVLLDFFPDSDPVFRARPGEGTEIPTTPSQFERIASTATEALATLQSLPLEQTFANLQSVLAGLDRLIQSPELERSLTTAGKTLEQVSDLIAQLEHVVEGVDGLVGRVDNVVGIVEGDVPPLLEGGRRALRSAERSFSQAEASLGTLNPNSALVLELQETLQEISEAARSVRDLAAAIEQQPEAIVFGRRPPEEVR